MIERGINKWVKRGLRFAVATAITVASVIPEANTTSVNSEVGSLTTEPILLILDPSQIHDLLQYKPWNLGSVGSLVEVSPEFFIRALDRENIPPNLILHTKVSKEGSTAICAYNYPETKTCHNIVGIDESSYPIDTAVLDPGKVYIEANSTRLKMEGMGKVKIEMEITDDQTKGLLASANTILSLLDIQDYFPLLSKAGSFSPN